MKRVCVCLEIANRFRHVGCFWEQCARPGRNATRTMLAGVVEQIEHGGDRKAGGSRHVCEGFSERAGAILGIAGPVTPSTHTTFVTRPYHDVAPWSLGKGLVMQGGLDTVCPRSSCLLFLAAGSPFQGTAGRPLRCP